MTLFLISLLFTASSYATVGPGHGSGPAHSSAFLCEELGGQNIFASHEEGTIEYCVLDEAKVSSMTLWYSLNGQMELALKTYLEHPAPNRPVYDAAQYCSEVGGEPRTYFSYDGTIRSDECVFNERGHLSMIDQWTLFRGPQYPGNAWLTRLLSQR